eukprot:TRINITY_DN2035_c0_g1_i1.p1 TRINITY_DN2035_c0_g1~~TRINITY_DN2035_c0_g1_i1.p1  ORF type:complete len:350 (+),score=93.02 TRINITY_DN2035_c0_g1_i1:48-1097(+)
MASEGSGKSENKMQYVRLGNTGLKVSRICLGCMSYGTPDWRKWVLDEEHSIPFFKRALELGINFFDTADVYSLGVSEEVTGRAIKQFAKREDVVIASKVFFPTRQDTPSYSQNFSGLSRKHIMESIDASLKRLGTDYIDLYQIHRWDYNTPIEETMEALHDLVKAGKVRYIGASSMYAHQFAKAQHIAKQRGMTPFVSMQNHYNLMYREEEREMIPFCKENGIALIPWSPLARGYLCGTRKKTDKVIGETPRFEYDAFADDLYAKKFSIDNDFEIIDRVVQLSGKKGISPAQLSLAWMLAKDDITSPIIGATKMAHLEEAVSAVNIQLSKEDIKYLEEIYRPHEISGHA